MTHAGRGLALVSFVSLVFAAPASSQMTGAPASGYKREPGMTASAVPAPLREIGFDQNIDQFAHAAVFEILTPAGVVSHYFYGIEFAPRDVKFALIQSSGNTLGTAVDQVLLLCYHYDPASGKYGASIINAVRAGGILLIAAFGTFLFVNLRRERAQARHIEGPL